MRATKPVAKTGLAAPFDLEVAVLEGADMVMVIDPVIPDMDMPVGEAPEAEPVMGVPPMGAVD